MQKKKRRGRKKKALIDDVSARERDLYEISGVRCEKEKWRRERKSNNVGKDKERQ